MTRYFLHLRDSVDIALDEEGHEFASLDSLNRAMLRSARDTMTGDVQNGLLDLRLRIDAETADRVLVHSVRFTDAVEIRYPESVV
jgi:hypothetical protein